MKKFLQKAAKGNERISQKKVQVCNASHFQKLWFVRFPAFGTISGQHLECVQRDLLRCFIQISLFKHFPMVYFGLKNQILAWTNDARLVFARNCHQSRNPASSSKASF